VANLAFPPRGHRTADEIDVAVTTLAAANTTAGNINVGIAVRSRWNG